jgi:protein-S-isoprenylcysteine O-methyltransferase Ste14
MSPVVGTIVFFFVAPGTVAGLIPWWITRWRTTPSFLDTPALKIVGAALIAAGLAALLDCFARFALKGGTPAPVFPTPRLVVTGLYRFVRNPTYVAVVALIAGQALLFASPLLLGYAALIWAAFHLFTIGYEEPTLRQTFSAQYEAYCASVPRWLPRRRPWTPPN